MFTRTPNPTKPALPTLPKRAAVSTTRRAPRVVSKAASTASTTSEKATALAIAGGGVAAAAALVNAHIVDGGVTSYLEAVGVPVISAANLPEYAIKWLHGANMGIVLATMCAYGTYLGWEVRKGNGNDETLTGDIVRDLHPKLMGAATLIFFLGGQGGLVFMLLQEKPLLESPHAITAFAGLGLLAANGAIGQVMKNKEELRTVHAYLGSSLMAVLLVHAGLGLQLGLSL